MWQMDQLPEWLDMGEEQDFVTPAVSLTEQLKKRMGRSKGQGGLGGAMSGMMDSAPMAGAGMNAAKGGPKSL